MKKTLYNYLNKKYGFIWTGRNCRLNCGGAIIYSHDDNRNLIKVASNEVIRREIKNIPKSYYKHKYAYKCEKRQIKNTEFVFLGTDKTLYYGGTYMYFRIKNSDVIIKVYGDSSTPYTKLKNALEDKSYELVTNFNPEKGKVSKYDMMCCI